MLRRLLHDDAGQDLIEYGILLALVTVGLVLTMPTLRTRLAGAFGPWSDAVWNLSTPLDPQ